MFVIEDDLHGEHHGKYATFAEALAELKRRASIPWNQEPNLPPCTSWRACGRRYQISEYDDTQTPWRLIKSTPVLEIDAHGVRWKEDFGRSSSSGSPSV